MRTRLSPLLGLLSFPLLLSAAALEGVQASLDPQGRMPLSLADTRVLFDGIPAPLLYVQSSQINAVAPFAVQGRRVTRVEVEYRDRKTPARDLPVADADFSIFTLDASGRGQGAILNEDGAVNSPPIQPAWARSSSSLGLAPARRILLGSMDRFRPVPAAGRSCRWRYI